MSKTPDPSNPRESSSKPKGRAGAKELLTLDLARRIALMVQQFPDSNIPVTWENVIKHTKLHFRKEFRRNVLSTKKWDGNALIADAFHDAKAIQSRQARDRAPKYANEPRSRLRELVAHLQAENLALRDQLRRIRAQQYDQISSFLDTRTPLNQLYGNLASTNKPESSADDPSDSA